MAKLSNVTLMDGLKHSNTRFRTISGLTFLQIIHMDKYSIEAAVEHNGKHVILKTFVDQESERAVDIIETAKCLERMKLPFVAKTTFYPKELMIITTDNMNFMADVILIEEDNSNVFDYSGEEDGQHVIDAFVALTTEIIRYGYLFDRLEPRSFKYTPERGAFLSLASNFSFNGMVNTNPDTTKAFHNFLTMLLLQLIIESYNNDPENWDNTIDYVERMERFDTRRLSHYLSGDYCQDLLILLDTAESRCNYNCDELRHSLGASTLRNVLNAFQSLSSQPENDNTVDFIGTHAEGRIAVRDKKSGLMGYLDFKHNLVIDYKYIDAKDFVEGLAVCIKDDLYGVIDKYGDVIVPFDYLYLEWDSKANLFYWRDTEGNLFETPRNEFLKHK